MSMNKNQVEGLLDAQGIEYRYEDCQDNEIKILSDYESRKFDIDHLISVLEGETVFDVDELYFWQTIPKP